MKVPKWIFLTIVPVGSLGFWFCPALCIVYSNSHHSFLSLRWKHLVITTINSHSNCWYSSNNVTWGRHPSIIPGQTAFYILSSKGSKTRVNCWRIGSEPDKNGHLILSYKFQMLLWSTERSENSYQQSWEIVSLCFSNHALISKCNSESTWTLVTNMVTLTWRGPWLTSFICV